MCLSLVMVEFWTGIVVFISGHGGVLDRYSFVYPWPWRSFGQVQLCLSLVMVEFWTGIVVFISGHGGVLDSYSFIYPRSWWSLGRVIYVYQLSWRCLGQIVVFIPGHGGVLERYRVAHET